MENYTKHNEMEHKASFSKLDEIFNKLFELTETLNRSLDETHNGLDNMLGGSEDTSLKETSDTRGFVFSGKFENLNILEDQLEVLRSKSRSINRRLDLILS